MPNEQATNWDIFKDRAESLLKRWDNFAKKHPEKGSDVIIKAFMSELNDDFTKQLIDKSETTV